jgi:hypothetical protein
MAYIILLEIILDRWGLYKTENGNLAGEGVFLYHIMQNGQKCYSKAKGEAKYSFDKKTKSNYHYI